MVGLRQIYQTHLIRHDKGLAERKRWAVTCCPFRSVLHHGYKVNAIL